MPSAHNDLDPGLAACLSEALDPELGVNIVDLGLVSLATRSTDSIAVELTPTSRACPPGEVVLAEVRQKIAASYPEVARVDVQLIDQPSPDQALACVAISRRNRSMARAAMVSTTSATVAGSW